MPQVRKRAVPVGLRPLKDRIRPGVRVLFVGINPGVRSSLTGHHFAGYSNRFWKLLFESGLVPEQVSYVDDDRLPEWGLGITNLIARPTPGVGDLLPAEYQAGRAGLDRKIRRFKPKIVVLVGVSLARALLSSPSSSRAGAASAGAASARAARPTLGGAMAVGLHHETLAGVPVFVLPNPSGRNAHFSYAEMLAAFGELRRHVSGR